MSQKIIKTNVRQYLQSSYSAWIGFVATLIIIVIFALLSPAEHSLGTHIRIVYLHGAWVWVSMAAFFIAAVCGAVALITGQKTFHSWSRAFGRTGLFFWITYLPLSLWAMQANWNGLFLAEPRWRFALVFAIAGILLQSGTSLMDKPAIASIVNIAYFITMMAALSATTNVMHPASPILQSDAWRIQAYFFGLVLLALAAAWQMARWWYKGELNCIQ